MSETAAPVVFSWNGASITGRHGDSVAAALYRVGIRSLGCSRKNHRPLGFSGSYLAGVLGRVDGRPNQRLDLEPAVEGLRVEAQNAWPSPRFDLLRAAQLIPSRWIRGGFEQAGFAPGGTWRFAIWERLLRHLAGGSAPPDRALPTELRPGRRVAFDCVVVGGGPAGREAANQAVAAGGSVALVSRSPSPGRFARTLDVALPTLAPGVTVFAGVEIFGLYRGGTLLAGAPQDHRAGAVVFAAGQVVLATGRRSIPPLVPGSHVPGVMDANTALLLAAEHGIPPGRAVVVLGTGAEAMIAQRLGTLGVAVIHHGPIGALRRIEGRREVQAVVLAEPAERRIACDAVIHAGPWRADPGLSFQAGSAGLLQLVPVAAEARVTVAGAAALPEEPLAIAPAGLEAALVCPCMDVTAGEVLALLARGESDPEILKRGTACGMGPCQGMPCWEHLRALIARATGLAEASLARPSHRPPRRGLTVAQAAGLDGLVEPDR